MNNISKFVEHQSLYQYHYLSLEYVVHCVSIQTLYNIYVIAKFILSLSGYYLCQLSRNFVTHLPINYRLQYRPESETQPIGADPNQTPGLLSVSAQGLLWQAQSWHKETQNQLLGSALACLVLGFVWSVLNHRKSGQKCFKYIL